MFIFIRRMLNGALHIGKAKIERVSHDLKFNYGVLDSARAAVPTLFHFGLLARITSCTNINFRNYIFFSAVGKESCGTDQKVLSQPYLHAKLGACEIPCFFLFFCFFLCF